jgi:hypothetical protein
MNTLQQCIVLEARVSALWPRFSEVFAIEDLAQLFRLGSAGSIRSSVARSNASRHQLGFLRVTSWCHSACEVNAVVVAVQPHLAKVSLERKLRRSKRCQSADTLASSTVLHCATVNFCMQLHHEVAEAS